MNTKNLTSGNYNYTQICDLIEVKKIGSKLHKQWQINEWKAYFGFDFNKDKKIFTVNEIYNEIKDIPALSYKEYFYNCMIDIFSNLIILNNILYNSNYDTFGFYTSEMLNLKNSIKENLNFDNDYLGWLDRIKIPQKQHIPYLTKCSVLDEEAEELLIILKRCFNAGCIFNNTEKDCFTIVSSHYVYDKKHEIVKYIKNFNELGYAKFIKHQKEQEETKNTIKQLKYMNYIDYLQTEHWKNKKIEKLKSTSFMCEKCNSKKDLQVHHISYENKGNENLSDLRTLCKSCHQKIHQRKSNKQEYKTII